MDKIHKTNIVVVHNQGIKASEFGIFLILFRVGKYQQKSINVTIITEYNGVLNKSQGIIEIKARVKNILSPRLGFLNLNFKENKNVVKTHIVWISKT